MSKLRTLLLTVLAAAPIAACGPSKEHREADSLAAAKTAEQARLASQLTAQKDSLTRVVLQADDFIMRIDSTVSKASASAAKGAKGKKVKGTLDPVAQQLENRKDVMARVNALVARAQATANQLAAAQKDNKELHAQIVRDSAMIADLNTTIQRQTVAIATLSARVDSLNGENARLGNTLAALEAQHNKAFYVIGREDDLVKRGIVVREGGANLLFMHPGRTLQIARDVDPDVFTAVDLRGARTIEVPEPSKRYRVVSRQSLDYAVVNDRDNESFSGNLKIAEPARFWGPSRFLVIVEQ